MHDCIMGVDFGTSKIAAVLIDPIENRITRTASQSFPPYIPCTDVSLREQDVEIVKAAFLTCIQELFGQQEERIVSVGFTGQMHGILGVDSAGTPATRFRRGNHS
jgi:sugar (pentulose or hexulose) kinase